MKSSLAVAVILSTLTGSALADYIPGAALADPPITGNTQYDGWIGLTSANYAGYGGFPGTGAWPAPIGSNRTIANVFDRNEPGDAVLSKVGNGAGGGPYLAGGSIYFGGFSADINNYGGRLAVSDATPVADLSNVIFQIQIGEAWTYDFFNEELPVLSWNGGSQNIAPTCSLVVERFYNGTVDMPTGPEDVYINTYMVQWDLSGLGPISDFRVEFTGVQHAQVYGLRLDQSDVFTPIPAPGAGVIAGLGALVALRRRRVIA